MNSAVEPQRFSAEVVVTPEARQLIALGERSGGIQDAYITIDSPEVADMAAHELVQVRARYKQLDEFEKRFTKPALQIVEAARDLFRGAKEALKLADTYLAARLSEYEVVQRRLQEDASRKLQEAARAERAKEAAEVAERAAQAQAEAQAAADAAAKANGTPEGEKAAIIAEAAAVTAAVAAQEQAELALAPLPATEVTKQKVAGVTMRDHWVAELEGPEVSVKAKIILACQSRPELQGLLTLDMSAADSLARALKRAFNVPGLRAVNKPVVAKGRGK